MKRTRVLLTVTALSALLLSSCATGVNDVDNGRIIEARHIEGEMMVTKAYDYSGFTEIRIDAAFKVEIVRADAFSIMVDAEDFRYVKVELSGNTLKIGRQGIDWFAPFHQQPDAKITLPVLTGIEINGASHGTITGFQSDNDLAIELTGASKLDAAGIAAGNLRVEVSGASALTGAIKAAGNARITATGASRVDLTGSASEVNAKVSGASRAELSNFVTHDVTLDFSGASNGAVNLNGTLNAHVSGASNLVWTGNPTMGDIATSGASSLRRR